MEKNTIEMEIRVQCEECKGSGIVQSPVWEMFNKWYNSLEQKWDHKKDGDPVDYWFKKHGADYGAPDPDQEPEEYECHECEGTGKIIKWMPITEVLELLITKIQDNE